MQSRTRLHGALSGGPGARDRYAAYRGLECFEGGPEAGLLAGKQVGQIGKIDNRLRIAMLGAHLP